MRSSIRAYSPIANRMPGRTEAGAEAIVTTASACGAQVKDYGHLLQDDARYAEKAARISALARDIGEVLAAEDLAPLAGKSLRLAYHPPCTLQHGQKLPGLVENVLRKLGHVVLPVSDAHLCCGAAGTYSLLQPEMSQQLREEKVSALMAARPEVIVSANIGCITHLGAAAGVPVKHWIELFDI